MYDFNDAEPQRGNLIDPCFAKIVGVLRPGGVDGPAPSDRGLLKASKSSADVLMLDWEFTVAEGRPFFWFLGAAQVLADHGRGRRRS